MTVSSSSGAPLVIKAGDRLSIVTSAGAVGTIAIPGEGVAQTVAASTAYYYGPYSVQREAIVRLSSGSYTIQWDGDAALTAAEVAAIKQVVSGDGKVRTAIQHTGLMETVATAGSIWNHSIAVNVPCNYTAIRIGYPMLGGTPAVTGLTAIAAATDDVGDLSYANAEPGRRFLSPKKAGTSYDAIAASGPGWRAVTWGGAASLTQTPSADVNATDYAWSDLIDLAGTPDASGRFPGWCPLLVRINPGTGNFTRVGQVTGLNSAAAQAELGALFNLSLAKTGADYVSAPSGWTSAISTSSGALTALPIAIEAWSADGTKSILICGDSRFAQPSSDDAAAQYRTTQEALHKALIASGKRVSLVSAAMGGITTQRYLARALTLTTTIAPDVAVYLGYSINDGVPTAALLQAAKVRILRWMDRCKSIGCRPGCLVTIFPYSGGYGSAYAYVQAFESWCGTLGVPIVSPMQLYGNGVNGDWSASPVWNTDANHMTSAGYVDLAARINTVVAPML